MMTVKELIDKLQQMPQDAQAVIYTEPGWSDIVDVTIVFGDMVAIKDAEAL